jgi:hypothetical protein
MKIQLLLADLVALLEVVDEHIDRTFPGVGPPASLRKLRTKLIHMTRMYPEAIDRSPGGPFGKSNRGKAVRKRRPQTQASR